MYCCSVRWYIPGSHQSYDERIQHVGSKSGTNYLHWCLESGTRFRLPNYYLLPSFNMRNKMVTHLTNAEILYVASNLI